MQNQKKYSSNYLEMTSKLQSNLTKNDPDVLKIFSQPVQAVIPAQIYNLFSKKVRLEKRKKYLHIALNSTLEEAREII